MCISDRWRPSRNGGRTVAQPAATRQQLKASQRVAAARAQPTTRTLTSGVPAEVSVLGHLGHEAQQVQEHIIAVLSAGGVKLTEKAAGETLPPGSWGPIPSSEASGPSGRMRLQLKTVEQAALVHSLLHEKTIQRGSDVISLAVAVDEDLAEQAKNSRRGASRRPGPPQAAAASA